MPNPKIRVVAAVFNIDGEILAFRRGAAKSEAGKWEFPGGKIEENETPQEALIREIREELSVEIEVGDLIDQTQTSLSDKTIDLSCYAVAKFSERPTGSLDHDAIESIKPAELLELDWAEPDIPAVRAILGKSTQIKADWNRKN